MAFKRFNVHKNPVKGSYELQNKIVEIAIKEWKDWGHGSGKGAEPKMMHKDNAYSKFGVGIKIRNDIPESDKAPCGVAFNSFVIRKAYGGRAFYYHHGHSIFTASSILKEQKRRLILRLIKFHKSNHG